MQLSRAGFIIIALAPYVISTAASAEPQVTTSPSCQSAQLHAELDASLDWRSQLEELRVDLRRARVDPCAHVDIRRQGEQIVITVRSRGRIAARILSDPNELIPTVEALVVLPPLLETKAELPPNEPPPPKAAPPPEPIHIELAGGGAVRVGGNLYAGGGIAAAADAVVDSYIIGISARWDVADSYVSRPTGSGFNMNSGAIGIMFGRRADFDWGWLDGLVGANVVVESQEGTTSVDEIGGETADVRPAAYARLAVGRRIGARPYLQSDVEVSPARLTRPRQLDPALPILPAWSVGLAVGVMWGLR